MGLRKKLAALFRLSPSVPNLETSRFDGLDPILVELAIKSMQEKLDKEILNEINKRSRYAQY